MPPIPGVPSTGCNLPGGGLGMADEALAAALETPAAIDAEAGAGVAVRKLPSNVVVIDGGLRGVAPMPIALAREEAKGMGNPEPDPDTAEAAERLRHGRLGYCAVKRLFDIAFSLLIIVAFSWLFLLTAIAVKIDDPSGPVFFGQDRVGRDGKCFRMWKFRSMCADAEAKLAELQAKNEKDGPVFKMADDPRITRVGRVIRKTSIDELPQFFNVLLGQMSVVGPRPALPKEVATYTPRQNQRLLIKPGMTCYWQTRLNRDAISFAEWVELDLLYIKKSSVWTDFKLVIQTIGVVLTAQGS